MSTTGWIILGVIVVVALWAVTIYNNLVAMAQRTNQAFATENVGDQLGISRIIWNEAGRLRPWPRPSPSAMLS